MPTLKVRGETSAPSVFICAHQDDVARVGYASGEYFALVHTPVRNWSKSDEAKQAVESEWKKLDDQKAWLWESVREYDDVRNEALKDGETVHFGDLMRLCFVKNSQLDARMRKYKGRLVFRGDNVRDESGHLAVFSEQGTSASHLSAAKFLDAIGEMPDCDCQDSDAQCACTQTVLGGPKT